MRMHSTVPLLALLIACGPKANDEEAGDEAGSLADHCVNGCEYLLDCAPAEFAGQYPTIADCSAYCTTTYAACEVEAHAYLDCFEALTCEQAASVVTGGPLPDTCQAEFDALSVDCPP